MKGCHSTFQEGEPLNFGSALHEFLSTPCIRASTRNLFLPKSVVKRCWESYSKLQVSLNFHISTSTEIVDFERNTPPTCAMVSWSRFQVPIKFDAVVDGCSCIYKVSFLWPLLAGWIICVHHVQSLLYLKYTWSILTWVHIVRFYTCIQSCFHDIVNSQYTLLKQTSIPVQSSSSYSECILIFSPSKGSDKSFFWESHLHLKWVNDHVTCSYSFHTQLISIHVCEWSPINFISSS